MSRSAVRSLSAPVRIWVMLSVLLASLVYGHAPYSVTNAAPRSSLQVDAPKQVDVGQPIEIQLTLKNAVDVAGYETHVLFDPAAAHFSGLQQRKNDLKKLGRDVGPLTAIELPTGVAIGLYSCPVDDCVDSQGPKKDKGGQGTVVLARLTIGTDQPGTLAIAFDALKFVDAAGKEVAVDVPTQSVNIQVGPNGAGPQHPAPGGSWKLAATAPAAPAGPFDLTGDGAVTHADAAEVALAWTDARERGTPCNALPDPSRDVNHDGCVDVADVQLIAGSQSTNSISGAAGTNVQQPIARIVRASAQQSIAQIEAATFNAEATIAQTFSVDTASDSSDASVGDGICQANVATSGKCTLRAAIQEANAHAGSDTIAFNIPGSGVRTIQLNADLPALSDTTGPTTINGYSQPGATPNSDPLVSNAQIMVQLAGTGPSGIGGLRISSRNNVVRGLALYNFKRSVYLYSRGATGNIIVGNFIGTDAAGAFQATNSVVSAEGVIIAEGAAQNRVGGTALADRNVISGNSRHGIATYFEATDGNVIRNNLIGLGPAGNKRLPNGGQGIDINSQSSYNVVGGTGPGERNVLSGNALSGVEISHDTLTVKNQVLGNYIGTDVNGTAAGSAYTYNTEWGVHVEDGVNNNLIANNVIGNSRLGGVRVESYNTIANQFTNNRIGVGVDGSAIPNSRFGFQVAYHASRILIGPGNIIANNPEGVSIVNDDVDFNTITRNAIYNNKDASNNYARGIDLDPQSMGVPNPNDDGDIDTGANEGLNYPVLTSATQYQVTGTACKDASVPKPCTVEVFLAERGAGAYGQGKKFVGAASTNSDGTFSVAISGVNVGEYVTSTATDATGNTSEFGANRVVVNGTAQPTPTPTPSSSTAYVNDTFSRNVTDGWGSAETGGGYALEAPSRPTVDYDVNGSAGTMTSGANQSHSAYLPDVSALNVDISFRVKTDKAATGGSEFTSFVARRVGTGTQYLGRLGFDGSGNVFLQAAKSEAGTVTFLGSQVAVPGVKHTANSYLRLRGQVVGTNPTTIRLKVWADGQAEPTTWQYSVTDSTASLQAPGAVGLRTYVSSSVTSVPVVFSFDDLRVTNVATP